MAGIKRKALTISEKVQIIHSLQKGETNASLCKRLKLSSSTISTLWKNREIISSTFSNNITDCKKLKKCEKNDVDEALLHWFKDNRQNGCPINGPILKLKAENFAKQLGYEDFQCNNGWLDRFKKRHNIVYAKISGEASSVDLQTVSDWITNVWPTIKSKYREEDIFNADETALFYKMTPDKTFRFKNEKCIGGTKAKDRLTVLLAANMTGTEKKKLFVIGKAKNPRCFNKIKKLPVTYKGNKKAWMTADIFTIELQKWDGELRMKNRKILLLVDNCTAHPQVKNLSNIELQFLPPNTTSVMQPMDQGIIRSFKCFFRRFLTLMIIENIEKKLVQNIDVLSAIRLMSDAWNNVSASTIKNCFIKAGLKPKDDDESEDDDLPLSQWLKKQNLNTFDECENLDDYVNVDNQVLTSGILTDEDIIQDVMSRHENTSEDDDESQDELVTNVSYSEAQTSLLQLTAFFEKNFEDEKSLNALSIMRQSLRDFKLKGSNKQTKVTEYFSKD